MTFTWPSSTAASAGLHGDVDAFRGGGDRVSDRRPEQWQTWVRSTLSNCHQLQPGQRDRCVNRHQGCTGERGEA